MEEDENRLVADSFRVTLNSRLRPARLIVHQLAREFHESFMYVTYIVGTTSCRINKVICLSFGIINYKNLSITTKGQSNTTERDALFNFRADIRSLFSLAMITCTHTDSAHSSFLRSRSRRLPSPAGRHGIPCRRETTVLT